MAARAARMGRLTYRYFEARPDAALTDMSPNCKIPTGNIRPA
jgi:hypothetical protein